MEKDLANIKLYTYFRSSCSWRVRIALNFKGIQYEPIFVHLLKNGGEQKSEEYQKINPMKHVPALIVGDDALIESMAICEYLEEVKPDPPLLPKDPIQRAKIRAFCELINSGIQPLQNLKVLSKVEVDCKYDKMEWLKYWVLDGLTVCEKYLTRIDTKGKYCFGDEVTLADVFLVPQLQGIIDRFGYDMSAYPRLLQILENLKKLKAFDDAQPKNQPDALSQCATLLHYSASK